MVEVGKAAYEMQCKPPEKINVVDLQREMGKKLAQDIEETVERHKELESLYYIKLLYRRERTLPQNHIRYQVVAPYFAKPAPEYDTSVFSVDNKTGEFRYHWTIPDEESCQYILQHQASLPSEEWKLCEFVNRFADGTLD